MPDLPDLTDTIADAATGPASAASDGQSATARPLPDVIEADKYFKANAGLDALNSNGGPRSGWAGLRPARAIPPGAV